MVDSAGNVKVMDFGVARAVETQMTLAGAIIGTPAYMAPEQAEGKAVDARADIYALGLILYEMFTGSPAFSGDTPVAVALKQIRETPTPPRELEATLPAHIEKVILKCLEKNPAQRFQSVDELEAALTEKAEEGRREAMAAVSEPRAAEGPLAPPPTPGPAEPGQPQAVPAPRRAESRPSPPPYAQRSWRGIAWVVLGVAILALGFVLYLPFFSSRSTSRPPQPAPQQEMTQAAQEPPPQKETIPDARRPAQEPLTRPVPQLVPKFVLQRTLEGHSKSVNAVAFSPDGRWVASGSEDKTVKLWEVATGRQVRSLQGHVELVWGVAFTPDGRWLASGSDDTTVKLWQVSTGLDAGTERPRATPPSEKPLASLAPPPASGRTTSPCWSDWMK